MKKNKGIAFEWRQLQKIKVDDKVGSEYRVEENPYPCYKCENRQLGCHETCAKYLKAKKLKGAKK